MTTETEVQFGDLESGEFRLFFELGDSTQTKICLSIDSCGVVILDSATVTLGHISNTACQTFGQLSVLMQRVTQDVLSWNWYND